MPRGGAFRGAPAPGHRHHREPVLAGVYSTLRPPSHADLPYYKAPFYEHNLELDDYIEMASILAKIKARFILRINDHPEMRKAFHLFNLQSKSWSSEPGCFTINLVRLK